MLIFTFYVSIAAAGDKIYQWVDENGVKHYSDVPPETGREVTVREGAGRNRDDYDADDRRKNFDRMVEQLNKEMEISEAQRKRELKAIREKEHLEAEKKRQAELEKKRSKILKEIEMLEKRAMSPTFTEGMRKAQIDKLKKQLQELK